MLEYLTMAFIIPYRLNTWESNIGKHSSPRSPISAWRIEAGEFFALPLVKWRREDDDRFSFSLDDLIATQ